MGGTLGKIVGLILGVMILAGCTAPVTGVDTVIQEAQKAEIGKVTGGMPIPGL